MTQIRITDDREELATHLASMDGLIAFDGYKQMGKSTLAEAISETLGCEHVNGDEYVNREDVYVDVLRIDELRTKIMAGFSVSPRVLLHCVCARAVVTRLGLTATAYVYVQHDRPMGGTASSNHYDALCAEDDGFEAYDRPELSPLERELLRYHADFRPSAAADIHYTWVG